MSDAIQTDVLVIGSGLGGIKTGLRGHIAHACLEPEGSNTYRAQCEISDSIIGLRNGILTALLILDAADQAHDGRGCHCRID